MTMDMLVATRNRHKLEEIRSILRFPGLTLSSLLDHPDLPEVDEDGQTFEANAVKKAVEVAKALGRWALADDSGLEVDALGGAPGVYSARYAGEPVSYDANNRKLLKELGGCERRSGRFRCVIALSDPSGKAETVEGACEGRILHGSRGVAGFGYDPLFVPEGHTQTVAEMDAELKNRISHRARALEMALQAWSGLFRSGPAGWDQGLRREPGPET